jgi:hypothetical protein
VPWKTKSGIKTGAAAEKSRKYGGYDHVNRITLTHEGASILQRTHVKLAVLYYSLGT